jgi:hypothetical protein
MCLHIFLEQPAFYLNNVLVGERLVWLVVFSVLEQHFVHVSGGVLVQFVGAAEDYQGDLTVAQNTQFVCLFHHAKLAFVESHLKTTIHS